MLPPPPTSTLFPYTTLFRSCLRLPAPLDAVIDVWRLRQYAGGLLLPLRDGTAGQSSYGGGRYALDRKSTRLNSSHRCISYAVFCLKKKKTLNSVSTNLTHCI